MSREEWPSQLLRYALAAFALTVVYVGTPANSAEFYVNTTEDHMDFICDGDCSLREAVWLANFSDGTDTIYLPAGTFTLSEAGANEDDAVTGDLDITGSVLIFGVGAGSTSIDATGLGDRVLNVIRVGPDELNVGLAQLTIIGGQPQGTGLKCWGGGIFQEGGTLALSDVTVTENVACSGGGVAISSHEGGTLVLNHVAVTENVAERGGGIYLDGSVVDSDLTAQTGSLIMGNSAVYEGGGIYSSNADLSITDTTITANRARSGGGVSAWVTDATISRSTISHNSASQWGGGLFVAYTPDFLDLGNSTIAGNSAEGRGGAVFIHSEGKVRMASVTSAGNVADQGIAIAVDGQLGRLELVNTIVTGYCLVEAGGTVISYGGNLESPLNTCNLTDPSDQVAVTDPMLSPLGHFGGPTATVLPLAGSPVIDAVADCSLLFWDQRGMPRSDTLCDSGSVERQTEDMDPLFFDNFESGNTSEW